MSRLTDLLRQLRSVDAQLGADLEKEIAALTKRRSFGLVFERHQPEAVELPGQPVRRTSKVRVLPQRGDTVKGDQRLWRVESLDVEDGARVARLVEAHSDAPESAIAAVDDLVVVAEFEDKIYPGLVETGRVENGGDKPFHTVINAENFHALEMLTYTHRGKIDAIYIDPPYNSGARDWKYNNDYVEEEDDYRHSKWLAFMERRLLVARDLLSRAGALVVTIDEHEVSRLGVLLDQVFPEFSRQLVTIVNNPKGVTQSYLSRVEEYAFFVFAPEARLGSVDDDLLTHRDIDASESAGDVQRPRWKGLLRSGDDALRADRKDMFYPIWLERDSGRLVRAGEPLPWGEAPSFESNGDGLFPIWPIRRDLQEGRWGVGPNTLNSLIEQGFASAGKYDKKRNSWAVSYLSKQVRDDLELGLLEVRRFDSQTGVADVAYVDTAARRVRTVWHRSSHDAGAHGTDLTRALLGVGRSFPFPKSLYAVEDALRPLLINRPDAVVLDFFSGSGTTAHAVMRLNRQDQGRRQCISVTNNEVSAGEQGGLRERGLRPGDDDWERWGICDYITKPRIRAAITGRTPDGVPIKGDYKFTDESPMADGFAENAAFFTLTYETPLSIRHNRAFERIAPMLWLRAGSTGRIIDDLSDRGWDVSDVYAVLKDIDSADAFLAAVRGNETVRTVFVVTDNDAAFQMVCRELPSELHVVQLYESYLQNFELNQGCGF